MTETLDGGTVTTVKRKVVTVTQGKEEIVEDSQLIVDTNHTTLSSVVDSGFVVVEKEDAMHDTSDELEANGKSFLNLNVSMILCEHHLYHGSILNLPTGVDKKEYIRTLKCLSNASIVTYDLVTGVAQS